MAWRSLASVVILAAATRVAAVPESHAIHESRDTVPPRWLNNGRISPDSILQVRVGLTQSNLDLGPDFLMAVSDPTSPTYGQHWTAEQVIEAFQPSEETTNAVLAWLTDAGISNVTLSDNKGWLAFNRPAGQVEALLHAEYYAYEDIHSGRILPSCDYYHVPKDIQQHIDYITPGVKLLAPTGPTKKKLRRQSKVILESEFEPHSIDPGANEGTKHCDDAISPACVAALYKIPPGQLKPNPKNQMGLYESEAQRWDQVDLNIFFHNWTNFRIPRGTTPVLKAIDGGDSRAVHEFTHTSDGGEIMLDLDIAYPIVYPQEVVIWDENDNHYQNTLNHNDTTTFGFNELLDAIDGSYCTYSAYGETGDDPNLDPKYPDPERHGGWDHPLQCGVFKPPRVLSVSYGSQEVQVPIAYQRRQCNEYLKLGLRGVSFFWASGDSGVGDIPAHYGGVTSTGCVGPKNLTFNPAWPNSCPWITNVGATEITPGHSVSEAQPESAVLVEEKPVELTFASGGGFSNIYPMPKYQQAAVNEYLTKYNPPYPYYSALAKVEPNPAMVDVTALQGNNTNALYNRIGRAYPDVSANGLYGVVVIHGRVLTEGGTSQSAPLFASVINRINEERLAAGKSALGFVNPALYANPSVLNDVVNGSNPGCFTKGFSTAPGWDPATGLGTPDYPKMLEYFMGLP